MFEDVDWFVAETGVPDVDFAVGGAGGYVGGDEAVWPVKKLAGFSGYLGREIYMMVISLISRAQQSRASVCVNPPLSFNANTRIWVLTQGSNVPLGAVAARKTGDVGCQTTSNTFCDLGQTSMRLF